MRLALIAPTYERVPPFKYGGTELVAAMLADSLVDRGHDVTLFATADSVTSARLSSVAAGPYRYGDPQGLHHAEYVQLANAQAAFLAAAQGKFDVINNHAMIEGLALAAFSRTPVLTTCHNTYVPETASVWDAYPWYHHALSASGAAAFPEIGSLPPIHHGIDVASFQYSSQGRGYLLFLGRFSPVKGAATAIEVARLTGRRLVLAGKVDPHDEAWFSSVVQPAIDGSAIEYVGEVDGQAKRDLLGGADALLFPIAWQEPFGLVMIEALASGTPVIGFDRASVPEIVEDGVTGFVVDDVGGMAAAVDRLSTIDRSECRAAAQRRFRLERMIGDYERAYELVAESDPVRPIAGSGLVGAGR